MTLEHPMLPTADSSRRGFLSQAAGVAAGSAALALAPNLPSPAKAAERVSDSILEAMDDSTLLELEEQFFEQHELATSYNGEIIRLSKIWHAESSRLYDEALAREVQACTYLTPEQRWAIVSDMPESREHARLGTLQEVHFAKMDALVKQMWAIPALTPEGRRAKVLVALNILPDDWRAHDEMTDYGIREARQLLIEFIGGEPGEQLRNQFI
jgi:hypothetical protein